MKLFEKTFTAACVENNLPIDGSEKVMFVS